MAEKIENVNNATQPESVNKNAKYDNIYEYDAPAYRPRKKRFGDRREGRKLRTLPPMSYLEPYIMDVRSDSQNQFEDVIDITNIENYLAAKHAEGYTDMTILHVILAAYVRVVAERPGINRFIAGQKIFARNNIECVMTIKKEMSLESPDTCIKVVFDPRDNIYNVYKKFQKTVHEALEEDTGFDGVAKGLNKIPGFIFRGIMGFLRFLDYHGWLPKSLLKVSPFHGSMIITSMGSLGIPAIYHHLYNFGTLPIFVSYGSIFTADAIKRDGTRERHRFVTFKVVTDERICDGYYYASAFKRIKRYLHHPEVLDQTLTEVVEDID
ncbi:MAG: hypothetical protein E7678_01210 [Ruminococcaceae bacterium]|nr:hypothetical protein [Oscillospiraceae bacterium]